MLETFLQDLRYGARMLRKNPGFTAIAVLTLALGIGATTAIFSVVNTLLLSPLPFADSNRIVLIQESNPKLDSGDMGVSAPDVADFRRLNHVFEDVGAYSTTPADMSGRGEPSRVIVTLAQTSVFASSAFPPSSAGYSPKKRKHLAMTSSFWNTDSGRANMAEIQMS